jgi:hypothetical protein
MVRLVGFFVGMHRSRVHRSSNAQSWQRIGNGNKNGEQCLADPKPAQTNSLRYTKLVDVGW